MRKTYVIFAVACSILFLRTSFAQGNKPVALLKGEVSSAKGGKIPDVTVTIFKGTERVNSGKTNSDGKFQIILQGGADYRIAYSNNNYYYKEESLNIPVLDKYKEIPLSETLRELELGTPYPFNALVFEPRSSKIEQSVMGDLENIANVAKRSKLSLKVTVFPDEAPSGKKAKEQNDLAGARKAAITSFFLSKNITTSSLSVEINTKVPPGKYERTLADVPETTKKKKGKSKPPAPKKVLVPQYAEIVMQRS
jgi:hypothetical protein